MTAFRPDPLGPFYYSCDFPSATISGHDERADAVSPDSRYADVAGVSSFYRRDPNVESAKARTSGEGSGLSHAAVLPSMRWSNARSAYLMIWSTRMDEIPDQLQDYFARIGRKGGYARSKALTPEQRLASATRASKAAAQARTLRAKKKAKKKS
jgi:hypothetical protein